MQKCIALWNYGDDQVSNAFALHALGFEAFSFLGRLFDNQDSAGDEAVARCVERLRCPMTIHHRLPHPQRAEEVEAFVRGMEHIWQWQRRYGLLTSLTFDFNHPASLLAPLLDWVIRLFRGTGLWLACEDHPLNAEEMRVFAPLITPEDRFGLLIDAGHMNLRHTRSGDNGSQSVLDALYALPLPVIEVHLSGNHGLRDEHLAPEEGTFPMPVFVQGLKDIGFHGLCTIERVPRKEDWQLSLQRARQSMDWLSGLWA